MRRVRVQWENPVGLDVVLKLSGDNAGLYQIYSHHVVFGPSALVYIGMAAEQTFGVRFKQHEAYWLSEENDVEIRVGRLWSGDYVKDRGGRDWRQLLSAPRRCWSTGIRLPTIRSTSSTTQAKHYTCRTGETGAASFRNARANGTLHVPVMTSSQHVYEVRPRKDKRGVDLISDALPFGRLWYGEPNTVSNAIGYASFAAAHMML